MFANIKNRFISVIAPDLPPLPSPSDHLLHRSGGGGSGQRHAQQQKLQHMQDKFAYARPPFLQLLTPDELRASADHNVRPIIVARDISLLPWGTGYAECVNSGKSEWNEDQAAFCRQVLSDPSHKHPDLPYTYFGIFDGHAGYGAALAASHQFQYILHEKLIDCIDALLPRDNGGAADAAATPQASSANGGGGGGFPHPSHFQRRVNKDELIVGALEGAFFHMDSLIAQDRDRYRDAGGCTACVSLFIDGKMYVANAGDSRAILCQRRAPAAAPRLETREPNVAVVGPADADGIYPVLFSFDHTPETERPRLLNVARLKPQLLGKQYAAMEYAKRPHAKDLGQRILCRQGTMKGWTYKTLTRDDLRMPVVTGEGKRSRLLGTLGVTRGFGDHDLLAINTGIQIKPFLTPHPDVNYRDLTKIVSIPGENNEDGDYGILVMATDGLWDVSENEAVSRTVFQTLGKYPTEKHRYTMAAQELVARARGKINDSGHWRLADSKAAATVDDISVICIPVYQYYKEHIEWEKKCAQEQRERWERQKAAVAAAQQASEAKEARESETTVSVLNGVTKAEIENNNDDENDDDEEEEEIVVELNRDKVQATIEIEEDREQEPSKSRRNLEDVKEPIELQLQATLSALEATEITASDSATKETPQTSPDKSKQQQQRNRNRKDKR